MKKKPVKKQSSSRVSSIAAKWLQAVSAWDREHVVWSRGRKSIVMMSRRDLVALCGSVLSQDEVKGQRRGRKK